MYDFWFYGNDGEFEYHIGTYSHVEYAFRHANVREGQIPWVMDGDGWSTQDNIMFHGNEGKYYITRQS